MTTPIPEVLVLTLADATKFDRIYSGFYSAISELYVTVRKTTVDDAYSFLLNHAPSAVLVDGGLASMQHQHLQKQLARYAKAGGTVIFGCMFYALTDSFALKDLFETFEVDWALGGYGREEFSLNTALRPIFGAEVFARLKQTYDMKCLRLVYAPLLSRVYLPTGSSESATLLYAASGLDQRETGAVFTQYSQGFLGYIGDFANEEGSQALTMAMIEVAAKHLPGGVRATTPPLVTFAPANPGCAVCGALTPAFECNVCRTIQYCSSVCQTADWNAHKETCVPHQ